MDEPFKTIAEHWAHYLERDMPPNAPVIQVMAMKHAFASGAASGMMLAILAATEKDELLRREAVLAHLEQIKQLCRG